MSPTSSEIPVLLSFAGVGRRLDISGRALQKAVRDGIVKPAALFNGQPLFAENDIVALTSNIIDRARLGAIKTKV